MYPEKINGLFNKMNENSLLQENHKYLLLSIILKFLQEANKLICCHPLP